MIQKGFVAVFEKPLDRELVSDCVAAWLENFERVEQVVPHDNNTLEVQEPSELMWEKHMQFRVMEQDLFAWVYLTLDHRGMETTGFADGEISFCLQVLLELPRVCEVVDERNQRRLDELEKAGII